MVALVKTVGTTKTTYGAMTDRQGSLRALYNGSGLVQSFSYDAWGNRRNPSTGNALTTSELVTANSITSRGYTCHEHMDEFGLINMNARIYDPALGMFISVDPLAEEYYDTYPYAYCGGDPVNRVDWTGEDYWSTSNTDEIYAFWKWYNKNGGQSDFDFNEAGWNHMTDEEFINSLETSTMTYNDDTRMLYMSNSKVENGELVIVGTSLMLPEPRSYKTILEEMIPIFGTASDAASELFYSERYGTWLGKDGKLRKMRVNGNQYTGGKIKYAKKWGNRYKNFSIIATSYEIYETWKNHYYGQNSFESAMLDTAVEVLPLPFPLDMWFEFWYEMGKIYGPLSANEKMLK